MSRMLQALKQLDVKQPRGSRPGQGPSPAETPSPVIERPAALPPESPSPERPRTPPVRPPQSSEVAPSASALPIAASPVLREAEPQDIEYQEMSANVLAQLAPSRAAVLVFASADDAEDVSGMLTRLAATLTQRIDEEVLVVDANFLRPRLAERFGIQSRQSLVDVLVRGADWRTAVCPTKLAKLHVLPGDRFPTADGRLPEGLSLAPLVEQWRRCFRLVLIGTASLADRDVLRLTRHCDGAYLVIQMHRTPRRAAQQAIRQVERRGGLVLGCVLTDV